MEPLIALKHVHKSFGHPPFKKPDLFHLLLFQGFFLILLFGKNSSLLILLNFSVSVTLGKTVTYPSLKGLSLFGSISSVQSSCSVMSNSLQPCGQKHARPPCPSQTPRVHPNPSPLSRWCHPATSSSVGLFSSCPQSFPASGSFQVGQLFTSGGQSIGVLASTSVLPMNTQDWSPLGWTGWISLQSKGLSRVFSNTTVQKHQFFGAQLSL